MKTVINTILFVAFATIAIGQDLAANNITTTQDSQSIMVSPAKKERIAKRQNASVAKQLQSYVTSNFKYSVLMAENCMEGEALIQIEISDNGSITKVKIVKSPNSEITNTLLKMIEGFTKVELEESVYYGYGKIRIPIAFSLR